MAWTTFQTHTLKADWQLSSDCAAENVDVDLTFTLVRRYQNLAQGFAYLQLRDFQRAQDVAQESFLVAYQRLPSLQDDALFGPWLKGIVFRCASRVRRKQQSWSTLESEPSSASELPFGQHRLETLDLVDKLLGELPQDLRDLVALFYLQDQSQQEVADFLELPETTVVNRLHKARKIMKKEYQRMVDQTFGKHKVGEDFAAKVADIVKAGQWLVEARSTSKDKPQIFDVFREPGNQPLKHVVIQRLPDGKFVCISEGKESGKSGKLVWDGGAGSDSAGFSDEAIRSAIQSIRGEHRGLPRICETGIKIVDLFCPLRTEGTVGFFGTHGVGRLVVAQELVHQLKQGETSQAFFFFVSNWDVAGTADLLAKDEKAAHDVAGRAKTAWIISRHATDPAYGLGFADLDVRLFCSPLKAALGLFPAIDPLYSKSTSLDSAIVGSAHVALANDSLSCLRRSQEILRDARLFELLAYGAFPEAKLRHGEVLREKMGQCSMEDRQTLVRAQRLNWFLSQPFFVAAEFTGKKGVSVPLAQTLDGCRRILGGEFDASEAKDLSYRGALDSPPPASP